jgi:ubiquitin-like modifier-activating enzyme ATG7
MDEPLQFVPFTSEIELPFYSALFSSKLEYDKLDDSARRLMGVYEPRDVDPDASSKLQLLGSALTNTEYVFRRDRNS